MEQEPLKFHMRLRVYRKERNFGPGVVSLMQLVQEKGSLSAACKEMHMSYSKAWKIINEAEQDLGFSLMEGRSGGESGGRTVVTEKGKEFLERYLSFETAVREQAERLFQQYYSESPPRAEEALGGK